MSPLLKNRLFIGGEFLESASGGEMDHICPATGVINGTVVLGGKSEIDRAVSCAHEASEHWESLGPVERRKRLGRLADVIEAWEKDFSALAAAEIGMPQHSFALRHSFAVDWIRHYQGWADKIGGDVTAFNNGGRLEYTRFEPYGVVGLVLTWNSALLTLTMKIPAALAAGNAVVAKPSELTPYTPELFAAACHEAGIPAGVVNIVTGGIDAGEALVVHPLVGKISFTGGVKAATAMMRSGAPLIKPFCFELGGKSAHLVFSDADIRTAARVLCAGLSNAGQSCTFGSRVYVHETVYDQFRNVLLDEVAKAVVGDPTIRSTTMGPVATASARDRILTMVSSAVAAGSARLIAGGHAPQLPAPLSGGFFVAPTVLEDIDPDCPLVKEEIFGPVICLFRFTDEAEAVANANNTAFGLSNYVHTNDLRRATRVTAQLKSGTVYLNDASRTNPGAPFGGYGLSGIGSEGGRAGLDEFLRKKTVGLV